MWNWSEIEIADSRNHQFLSDLSPLPRPSDKVNRNLPRSSKKKKGRESIHQERTVG